MFRSGADKGERACGGCGNGWEECLREPIEAPYYDSGRVLEAPRAPPVQIVADSALNARPKGTERRLVKEDIGCLYQIDALVKQPL